MHARLVTGAIAPEHVEEAIKLWQSAVAPSVRQRKGFRSARLLVDRASGQVASMGLWETEADVQGTVEWNQEQVDKFAGFFSAPPNVGLYGLVADVLPP